MKRIAVIGAGFGGLAASAILAHRGYAVEVFEQQSGPGGKAGDLRLDGWRFDTGPSLFTMPAVFEKCFALAGGDLNAALTHEPMELITRYFWDDGSTLDAWQDTDRFATEVEKKLGDGAEAVKRYLKRAKKIYDTTADIFLYGDPWDPLNIVRLSGWRALAGLPFIAPFTTMDRFHRRYFKDERTIQLFDRYATYTGSDPYRAPATLAIIPHVEYAIGARNLRGGVTALVRAMHTLAEKNGAIFHFNAPVDRILKKNERAAGIVTGGADIPFDAVVSNADVTHTYLSLLQSESEAADRYQRHEPSVSGVVFYWAMRETFPELTVNNIFFSADYRREFEEIFDRHRCGSDPTVYVNITSKFDAADAPAGGENWFVLVNAPYDDHQDWDIEVTRLRDTVIAKVSRLIGRDIEPFIAHEQVRTPKILRELTNTNHGSIYDISSNDPMAAFRRQPARCADHPGVFFCGGSAHPGGGMPLATLSGMMAADAVTRRMK
ncbi:MAG TPA: phytoene desaturase family protein [bacterium]|nr:phytoene desaturase family protein [bacterium]